MSLSEFELFVRDDFEFFGDGFQSLVYDLLGDLAKTRLTTYRSLVAWLCSCFSWFCNHGGFRCFSCVGKSSYGKDPNANVRFIMVMSGRFFIARFEILSTPGVFFVFRFWMMFSISFVVTPSNLYFSGILILCTLNSYTFPTNLRSSMSLSSNCSSRFSAKIPAFSSSLQMYLSFIFHYRYAPR